MFIFSNPKWWKSQDAIKGHGSDDVKGQTPIVNSDVVHCGCTGNIHDSVLVLDCEILFLVFREHFYITFLNVLTTLLQPLGLVFVFPDLTEHSDYVLH